MFIEKSRLSSDENTNVTYLEVFIYKVTFLRQLKNINMKICPFFLT